MKFCKNQKNFNSIHVPVYIKRRSSSTQKILMLLSTSPPNICITVVLANTSIKKEFFSHFEQNIIKEKNILPIVLQMFLNLGQENENLLFAGRGIEGIFLSGKFCFSCKKTKIQKNSEFFFLISTRFIACISKEEIHYKKL